MSFFIRPYSSSDFRNQQHRNTSGHHQGPSATLDPTSSINNMASSKTIVVLSDDESDEASGNMNKPSGAKQDSPIEIDSGSDAEQVTRQSRETTRPKPPANPYSRNPFAPPPRRDPPRGSLWQRKEADRRLPQTPSIGSTAQSTNPAPRATQPSGSKVTGLDTSRGRPQLEPLRASQSQRQSPALRSGSQVSSASSSQVPSPEIPNFRPPTDSPRVRSSSAATSSFSTAFKQYAPSSLSNGPDKGLPLPVPAPRSTPIIPTDGSNRPICNVCARQKLQCDGAIPTCSVCRERGVTCSYTTDTPHVREVQLVMTPKMPSSSQSSKTERLNTSESKVEPASVGTTQNHQGEDKSARASGLFAAPATRTKIVLRAPHPQVALPVDQSSISDQKIYKNRLNGESTHDSIDAESSAIRDDQQHYQTSISSELSADHEQLPEVEPSLEAVTNLLEDLRKELYAWQETSTQAELRQATIDARTAPQPKTDKSLPDPFKALTEQRRSAGRGAQDAQQKKKVMVIRAPTSSFATGAVLLPKYKAIGRVSSSMLAPNYKVAKYRPYSAEDENDPDESRKYADWEEHYNVNVDKLKDQRKCQELVWLWKPWIEDVLAELGLQKSDLLYYFTVRPFEPGRPLGHDEEQRSPCRTCGLAGWGTRRAHGAQHGSESLCRSDNRNLAMTALFARAFHEMAGVSLWHLAVGGLLQPQYSEGAKSGPQQSNLCLICFRHYCPDHGSYEEPIAAVGDVLINDSERTSNVRKFVALPDGSSGDTGKTHFCGIFCVEPSSNLRQVLGRQPDGTIKGVVRAPKDQVRPIMADDEMCGPSCFWDVHNRRDITASAVRFQPFLSASQKVLVEKLIPFYRNNQRGPCLISRIIKDVNCLLVFNHIVFTIFDTPHPGNPLGGASDGGTTQNSSHNAPKKKRPAVVIDISKTADLAVRPPFLPCSHEGPCHNNPACSCAISKVHCERFCGCDDSCKRRFRGCTCKMGGRKICFEDSRCDCWAYSRECDPRLCGKCGVVEVLESSNKYRDDVRHGRCRNNRIQLGLPAPTTKAPSQVQGYGLYSRAEILMGDFIGEYTGEVIGRSEGNRRGTIYHLINQEYLFNLNLGQEIDASNNGNKMRFMNNSQREENINVEAKSLLCSGVVRIGLFAKRDVRAGEELLWKYGYSAELVKYFWEPGEKPATDRALIPFSKERLARNTGRNKLAGEKSRDVGHESSQSPVAPRKPKRKRPLVESPEQERDRINEDGSEDVPPNDMVRVIDDSDDSDYKTTGHISEDAEIDDEDLEEDLAEDLDDEEGEQSDNQPGEDSDDESDLPLWKVRGRLNRSNGSTPRGGGRSNVANSASSSSRSLERGSSGQRKQRPETTLKQNNEQGRRRKRKLKANDKRIGGKAQQQGWKTRKQNIIASSPR